MLDEIGLEENVEITRDESSAGENNGETMNPAQT